MLRFVLALLLVSVASACKTTRTIYVPDGEPVRLRESVHGAKVWVPDQAGAWTAGVMDLPEGWYALPDPQPEQAN
ncbi:hypothetical protein LLG95_05440 [bacterium]|nr:hypothetical protein [bacterium]